MTTPSSEGLAGAAGAAGPVARFPAPQGALARRAGRGWNIVLFSGVVALGLLSLGQLFGLTFIVPGYADVFSDFGVELSLVARQVLMLGLWMSGANAPFPGVLLAAPALVVFLALLASTARLPAVRPWAAVIAWILVLVSFVLGLAAIASLQLALAGMIQSMNGRGSV